MTYLAPILLSREDELKKRSRQPEVRASDNQASVPYFPSFTSCGGCRRRVERLRAVEHCSRVLLSRMFVTLPDAFRFFLTMGDSKSFRKQDFFLSDSDLETCFVTIEQLCKGLQELLLKVKPHPAPLSATRRRGEGRQAADVASWHLDIEDIAEEVSIGFRSQLSLLDFMRMFEWDVGLSEETTLQTTEARRKLEQQVRMEIREKTIVAKWRFLSMAVRSRFVYWRWVLQAATFAFSAWRAFVEETREMRRKWAQAVAHARLTCMRRCFEEWRDTQLEKDGAKEQV
jgi:hypothetical protein